MESTGLGRTNPRPSGRTIGLRRRFGVRVAVVIVATMVCMALAFDAVDVGAVGGALGGVKLRDAMLVFILLLCNSLVAMARFRVVLDRFGYSLAWRRLFAAFSIGMLGNQFVFNIIGQSIGRAGALTSSGVPFGATIIATLVERVFAAGVLAAAGLAAAWFLLPHFGFELAHGNAYFVSLAGGMTLAALASAAVSYRRGAAARTVSAAGRGVERFWPVALLTILAHCFMLGGYIAALWALGIESPTLEVAGALVIVMFAAALPISLGGWGIRELSAVVVLGAVGVEPPAALAAALVVGVLSLGVNLAIAIPGLFSVLLLDRGIEPNTKNASRAPNWNARLVMGCGTLIAVAIFFQVQIQSGSNLVTANAADIFALIGLGSLILLLADSRARFIALPRPMIGALLALSLLLAYGLMLGYANFGANAWALFNRGLGWLIILGYVAAGLSVALVDAERGRRLVLRLFVTAGTTVAALQLVLLIIFQLGFPPPLEAFPNRLSGYANNANAFAFQMTMTALAAIVADRIGVLGASQRWLTAVLVLTGLAIYFSGSRTGIGMFVMLLALSVVFDPPAERRAALATSLFTVVGVVLAATAIVHISTGGGMWIRTSLFDTDSDLGHWRTVADGWHLWIERPVFGHGLGAYVQSQLADSERILVFHSVPIWLMAEMGLIGTAVGLASFGCLALSAHRLMRDSAHRAWGAGILMTLICWGAANLVHDFAFQRSFWFLIALAFGLLPAADAAAGSQRTEPGSGEAGDQALARRTDPDVLHCKQ